MNTVSPQQATPSRRRLHATFGTTAIAVTAAATIAIGARALGVSPPPDAIPMFCPGAAAQCVQQNTVGPDLGAPLVHRHL